MCLINVFLKTYTGSYPLYGMLAAILKSALTFLTLYKMFGTYVDILWITLITIKAKYAKFAAS